MVALALSFGLVGVMIALFVLPWVLGRWFLPWSLALLTLATTTAYVVWGPLVSGTAGTLVYPVYASAPLVLFGAYGLLWERGRASELGFTIPGGRWASPIALSGGLVGIYLLLTLEPGLALGFTIVPSSSTLSVAVFFLTTPILVLGQEAVFRGYLLGRLSDRLPFGAALAIASGLFAFYGFSPVVLWEVSLSGLAPQLFTTVVEGFAIGIVVGLYYYRSDWSLLGPWGFRTGLVWVMLLLPISVAHFTWEFQFLFALIGLAGVVVASTLLLPEPRYRARHYLGEARQPRRRTLIARMRSRRTLIELGLAVVLTAVLIGAAAPLAEPASSSPVRFLAIASGSMVPTLHVGDLVVVERVAGARDIRTGDLVAYNAPYLSSAGPVVHRVVAIHGAGSSSVFTFKGDANKASDPRPVEFGQIVGRVSLVLPYLGNLVLFPPFTIGIVAFLALFTVYRSVIQGPHGRPNRPILPVRGDPR